MLLANLKFLKECKFDDRVQSNPSNDSKVFQSTLEECIFAYFYVFRGKKANWVAYQKYENQIFQSDLVVELKGSNLFRKNIILIEAASKMIWKTIYKMIKRNKLFTVNFGEIL